MIHFIPESADAEEVRAPYAEAVARLAGLRHALSIVDPQAADHGTDERLRAAWENAGEAARRCFDQRSGRTAAAAAAGLEAALGAREAGFEPNPAAMRLIADEIRSGFDDLGRLMAAR